jgi:DNA mismatch repair ATPase MutS
MEKVSDIYQQRIDRFGEELKQLKLKRSKIGWLRLGLIILTFGLAFYFFSTSLLIGWMVVLVGVTLFLIAVAIDAKNAEKITYHEHMLFINKEELQILQHKFNHREQGNHFLPHEHPYAADLDLFGEFSLYQYINRCTSDQGKALLADGLLGPSAKEEILLRQEAVKELAPQLQWRQDFYTAGMSNPMTVSTEAKIGNWLLMHMPYEQPIWKMVQLLYPVITLGCFVLYLLDFISAPAFSGLVGLFFFIGLSISKNIQATYSALSKIVDEIATMQHKLMLIENLSLNSKLYTFLQESIHSKRKASDNIRGLKQILNRFDYRLNILVFFVLNSFLLWDLRQLLSLNKWRKQHEQDIAKWFETIAHVEVLNSLATLAYNHSTWIFPNVVDEYFVLEMQQVGHPLINESKRVDNSFATKGTGKVSIITGSNMAGKSTFLRSIGINLVLAQMGSVVCAEQFTFSVVNLYSSMRIADNLAENTSTFYAELKKLKTIIEQVNEQRKVFILLDEILRGTNSLDRHTGSEALIKQFIRQRTVAVIATHDVALATLEKSYITTVKNYHFDVQVEGEELYFDYKLKPGVCQSMNASILMKKIGIELL